MCLDGQLNLNRLTLVSVGNFLPTNIERNCSRILIYGNNCVVICLMHSSAGLNSTQTHCANTKIIIRIGFIAWSRSQLHVRDCLHNALMQWCIECVFSMLYKRCITAAVEAVPSVSSLTSAYVTSESIGACRNQTAASVAYQTLVDICIKVFEIA